MGPGFVCSRGCTAAPLTGGLWFDCIDVQDLLGTVVESLAQCSGRPAGRRTWVGLSKVKASKKSQIEERTREGFPNIARIANAVQVTL